MRIRTPILAFPMVMTGLLLGLLLGTATASAQNHSPQAPAITEPQIGRVVAPGDLHMEAGPFIDQDAGDTHLCTDWEVVQAADSVRVWITSCIAGVERVHTHLGDGTFTGPLAGKHELAPETNYKLRVRFRDSSGDAATEWSPWSERAFTTGALTQVFPLRIKDVLLSPAPRLTQALPAGTTPARVRLEDSMSQLLLLVSGGVGGNSITNPPPLISHGEARIIVTAGSLPLTLPESELLITDDQSIARVIVLPAISLSVGQSSYFWISENGSTYVGSASQTSPDFSTLARGASVPWTEASDMRVEVVATGFQMPVNIAFVPNPGAGPDAPLYYVAELYGTIKVVRRNGTISDYATGLLNYNPSGTFPGSGEQGLAGIVVDPTNGDLFATALFAPNISNNTIGNPRVYRLTSADGGLTSNARSVILNMAPETQGQSHQVSNITFGPDGYLYVHVGDGFDSTAGRNLSVYRGKILRMTRLGQAISTNPYYNAGNGITATDYVYASGVRNPFGGAWRASDSSHYIVENGPSVDRFSKLVRGRDYGYDGSDASMSTFALYNWNPSTGPVNIAFIQQETFGGSGFPSQYWGRAYVTQSGATYGSGPGNARSKVVTEWVIDASGTLVGSPRPVAYYNGSGKSSAVAIAAGPDGLYFSDFYAADATNPTTRGARILRIKYEPPAPPLDCNGNGIDDAVDVASGTSPDCNGNKIPDECDIATGRSLDCNGNGIPDECEVSVALTDTFDSGLGAWVMNGSSTLTTGFVRLTPAQGSKVGTLIRAPLSTAPATNVDAAFDFRIGEGSGADGFCFAIFDASLYSTSSLFGEAGPGSITDAAGGPGAIAVRFDTYNNHGEGNNTIEVTLNGVSLGLYTPSFSLRDDVFHRAFVRLASGRITVEVTDASGKRETAFEGLEVSYTPFVSLIGFGGRTGGATDVHDIDNVTLKVPGPNDRNRNGIPDECECLADFDQDGFVTGDDFDLYAAAFEAGGVSADFNGDGFVTGDDFDAFVLAFEAGC